MSSPPFHLAFPVTNLVTIREFYTSVLSCEIGRESERWIDFNFFGHQITAHLDETMMQQSGRNQVDSKAIPARHFGVILDRKDWDDLVKHVRRNNIDFYIDPYIRFAGEAGEQRTFFIQDPCENFLEFKCFQDRTFIFKAE
ncbi:MAG: glyoxalase [Gammaproteobacteria bacterium]|nr:glyoxalase [Gammaproteobacteria bacterium]